MQCVECGGDEALTVALGVTLLTLLLLLPFVYVYCKQRKNEEGGAKALANIKRVLKKKKMLLKKIKAVKAFRQTAQALRCFSSDQHSHLAICTTHEVTGNADAAD